MATHKSAEKRNRQDKKHRERNIATKSAIKTKIKSVIASVDSKNKETSVNALKTVTSALAKQHLKA